MGGGSRYGAGPVFEDVEEGGLAGIVETEEKDLGVGTVEAEEGEDVPERVKPPHDKKRKKEEMEGSFIVHFFSS